MNRSREDCGLIEVDWPAPARVKAVITTRRGGVSQAPYDCFNLALHVGDDPMAVASNRQALRERLQLGAGVQWLQQVHGTRVISAADDGRVITADGCFTSEPGLACAVMTADCLPLLLCDRAATRVAAVHAGWRGLAAGILRSAVEQFAQPAGDVLVYLGPAISQRHFEVGVDVLEAFYGTATDVDHLQAVSAAFSPSRSRPLKFYANLYALARAELMALGVTRIYGGDRCTFTERERFFSYRRRPQTGRMASLIWLI